MVPLTAWANNKNTPMTSWMNFFLLCLAVWGFVGWFCILHFCPIGLFDAGVQLVCCFMGGGCWKHCRAFLTYVGINRCTFWPS